MLNIPDSILDKYEAILKRKIKDVSVHKNYLKWLRYFLDFNSKYIKTDSKSEQVRLFIEKLREKKQTQYQQKQAAYAISLYFELIRVGLVPTPTIVDKTLPVHVNARTTLLSVNPPSINSTHSDIPKGKLLQTTVSYQTIASLVLEHQQTKYSFKDAYILKSDSPEWDDVIAEMVSVIKTRHYSRKTLKTYALWSRQFQKFLKNKPPRELSSADVKAYLTYLAVNCRVAASTQNQAFNALLFLFRHSLKKDFGDYRDVPRAKKSKYIPVVLSRQEIDAVLKHLKYPYALVIKLLYGCGLRLFECLQVRVKDFNFDAGILTIHGKGKKDRTLPIPQTIVSELKAQLETVGKLHDNDLAVGYTGVFLDNLLEKKYPSAAKGFIWQWFFPQKTLTPIPSPKTSEV